MSCRVLPLEYGLRGGSETRLGPRTTRGGSLDPCDPRLAGDLERERRRVTVRSKLGDTQRGDSPHDPGRMALEEALTSIEDQGQSIAEAANKLGVTITLEV